MNHRIHRREFFKRVSALSIAVTGLGGAASFAEIAPVKRTGTPKRLAPMTAFERKIVHDAVAAAGQRSESEGEEPNRRVVVYPAQ